MERLNALLENKDILAAEEQLQQITDQAMADGHIDEDEQRQIDEAMRKVESLRSILKPKNQREKKTVDPEGKNDWEVITAACVFSSFLSVSVCCHPSRR